MLKFLRRLLAVVAAVALLVAAFKSALNWMARNEDDDYEVFEDDEHDFSRHVSEK